LEISNTSSENPSSYDSESESELESESDDEDSDDGGSLGTVQNKQREQIPEM